MTDLESLETKLNTLRQKWKNDYPKNVYDKRWPEFRVDSSRALWLKIQIEKLKSNPQGVTP